MTCWSLSWPPQACCILLDCGEALVFGRLCCCYRRWRQTCIRTFFGTHAELVRVWLTGFLLHREPMGVFRVFRRFIHIRVFLSARTLPWHRCLIVNVMACEQVASLSNRLWCLGSLTRFWCIWVIVHAHRFHIPPTAQALRRTAWLAALSGYSRALRTHRA